MKIDFVLSLATLVVCLSGCGRTYLANRIPPCEGLSEKMRASCVEKTRCYVAYELKTPAPKGLLGSSRCLYAKKKRDNVALEQKNAILDLMLESGLFSSVLEGEKSANEHHSMAIKVSTWIEKPNGGSSRYDFSFMFDVFDAEGIRHQYRMTESVINDSMAGNCASRLEELFGVLHRNVVNTLFKKMGEDGLFNDIQSASRQATTDKEDVISEERRKNLDSLLKSGVITEEEYRKELEKAK